MSMTITRPKSGWRFQKPTTHPGEILRDDFLLPLRVSQNSLAMKIRVPATRIGEIVNGRRSITPDTALRLSRFFGNSAEFWMNLQLMHDLSRTRYESNEVIEREIEVYAGSK
jgi:addiction module HigA family antidote